MALPRALTERQKQILGAIKAAGGSRAISPDVARQLIRRGLVTKLRTCQRTEWSRPVATLWVVELTVAGKNLMGVI